MTCRGITGFISNYRPQTKFAKVMFLHVSVILSTGGRGNTWAGTPSRTRYTPRPGTPLRTRYTLPGPGTPPPPRTGTPRDRVHPLHPRPGTPPWTRYTPWPVHPSPRSSACWEIRATSGRYASYWNAFLFSHQIKGNQLNEGWRKLLMSQCHSASIGSML